MTSHAILALKVSKRAIFAEASAKLQISISRACLALIRSSFTQVALKAATEAAISRGVFVLGTVEALFVAKFVANWAGITTIWRRACCTRWATRLACLLTEAQCVQVCPCCALTQALAIFLDLTRWTSQATRGI